MQAVNNSVSIPRTPSRPTLVSQDGKTDRILRIDAVVAQSWYVLGIALSTAAVLARVVSIIFPTSLSFTVLAVSLVALTLLAIKVTVTSLEPYMSQSMKDVADYIQATLGDLLLAMSDLFFQPLFIYKKLFPAKEVECDGPDIVVVHGYNGQSAQVSTYIKHRLEQAQMGRVHTINLGSSWLFGVDDHAKKLDAFLEKLKKKTGRKDMRFTIFAHSMGGVVAKRYHDEYRKDANGVDKVNIENIITLGSPMEGTPVAKIAAILNPFDKCTKDMRPDSELVKRLANKVQESTSTRFLHVASKNDLIIPVESALFMKNKAENVERVLVSGVGHCGLPFSDAVMDSAIEFIRRGRNMDVQPEIQQESPEQQVEVSPAA